MHPFARVAVVLALSAASVAFGQAVYKVVGADGRISYTDRPPADAKSSKEVQIAEAPSTPLPESILKYQAELEKSLKNRLSQMDHASSKGALTLYSAVWCGYCTRAKAYLSARGVAYREVDIDSPAGGREFYEVGGKGGIPLLLLDKRRIRGFSAESYDGFLLAKK